jgi:CRISPR-associated protein Csm3
MEEHKTSFIGNYVFRGRFECKTGLHIGGSKEKLDIGGVDAPVLRDPRTRYPYVPGSSLKGKLRSLLEFATGNVPEEGTPSTERDIVRLFGIGVNEKDKESPDFIPKLRYVGPSRLIVRDACADEETIEWWKKLDTDLLYTEYKSENSVNRITAAANPRFVERVAAGSRFEFELIYTAYALPEGDHKEEVAIDLANLRLALLMLEHNFLGKSGSRGYGRIEFHLADPVWLDKNDYLQDKHQKMAKLSQKLSKIPLKRIGELDWEALSAQFNTSVDA